MVIRLQVARFPLSRGEGAPRGRPASPQSLGLPRSFSPNAASATGTGCPRAQAERGSGTEPGESAHYSDSPRDRPRWGRACVMGQEVFSARSAFPTRLP